MIPVRVIKRSTGPVMCPFDTAQAIDLRPCVEQSQAHDPMLLVDYVNFDFLSRWWSA